MHRIALLFGLICFILAAAGSYFGAIQAVDRFEKATEKKLEQKMFLSGNDWGNIRANGLRLHLTGLAPNESARFDLLKSLGKLVEASRIRDEITLLEEENLIPPKFSLEALSTKLIKVSSEFSFKIIEFLLFTIFSFKKLEK